MTGDNPSTSEIFCTYYYYHFAHHPVRVHCLRSLVNSFQPHVRVTLNSAVTIMTTTSTLNPLTLPGLQEPVASLTTTGSPLECQDISDDLNAEWETLSLEEATMDVSSSGPEFAQLQATLLEASKGVTDSTDAEYRR